MWLRRSACACVLSLLLSLSLWAQVPSSPSTDSVPTASGSNSPQQPDSWSQLNSLLDQLDQAATDSSTGSQELRALLVKAQQQLTTLSQRLDESLKQATALSLSLTLSEQSLATSAASLKLAQMSASRRDVELWITRGVAAGALVWAAVKK
jgi:hypothetical protein